MYFKLPRWWWLKGEGCSPEIFAGYVNKHLALDLFSSIYLPLHLPSPSTVPGEFLSLIISQTHLK